MFYHMHTYEREDKLPAIHTLLQEEAHTDILHQKEIFTKIQIILLIK